jgi:hypothetical protein
MAITPGIGGYPSFHSHGRQGSVREMNAVGNKWTKAVAMRTPVPKCCEKNTNLFCPAFLETLFDIKGKAHPVGVSQTGDNTSGTNIPAVLRIRIMTSATT